MYEQAAEKIKSLIYSAVKLKTDVNAQDEDGNTPLMFLVELVEPLCRGFRREKIQKSIVLDIEEFAIIL